MTWLYVWFACYWHAGSVECGHSHSTHWYAGAVECRHSHLSSQPLDAQPMHWHVSEVECCCHYHRIAEASLYTPPSIIDSYTDADGAAHNTGYHDGPWPSIWLIISAPGCIYSCSASSPVPPAPGPSLPPPPSLLLTSCVLRQAVAVAEPPFPFLEEATVAVIAGPFICSYIATHLLH